MSRVEVIEEETHESPKVLDEIDLALKEIAEMEKKKKAGKKKTNKPDPSSLINSYITDKNLQNILSDFEKQKKQEMRKRYKTKLKVLEENRLYEDATYDAKGRKIGKNQKQYINIPQGELKNPIDVEKLKQVLLTVGKDPDMKRKFLEKSGIPDHVCKNILESVKDDKSESQFERIEEIL